MPDGIEFFFLIFHLYVSVLWMEWWHLSLFFFFADTPENFNAWIVLQGIDLGKRWKV